MSDNKQTYPLIVVLGPTATGKTGFAAELAWHINAEIISADSRQIYRRMDLGTGKDYSDYIVHQQQIPYHLIDIHEPGYKYNVYEYQKDFLEAYAQIREQDKQVILCGGTGMYIEAVTKGYKLISVAVNEPLRDSLKNKSLDELGEILAAFKNLHNRSDTDTVKRAIRAIEIEKYYTHHEEEVTDYPTLQPIYLGMQCGREIRRERITSRLKTRLKNGMIEEVEALLKEGIPAKNLIYYGLEYKFLTQYLLGEIDHEAMFQKLNTAIHQFAKRQTTWFRKMERQGINIHWIDLELPMDKKIQEALKFV